MRRSGIYVVAGILAVMVVVLAGYILYDQAQGPRLEVRLDQGGIEVNGNG
jgi:hypothetical protein